MYRYLAIVWNRDDETLRSRAAAIADRLRSTFPDWKCVLDLEGLQVHHSSDSAGSCRACRLRQDAGAVLGTVFEKESTPHEPARRAEFDDRALRIVRQTRGRYLVRRYWGRYVAILRDEECQVVRILRDPTGAMPCYITEYCGIRIVCSHTEDCVRLGLLDFTINCDHIATYLWFQNVVSAETGLASVRQIYAGECIAIGDGRSDATTSFYWSPDRICESEILEDRRSAMRELRRVIEYCVAAWASCHERILHSLSGGLDSAIVLACLSRNPVASEVVCENYFTENTPGDERDFARIAAQRAGVELIESLLHSSSGTLESMLQSTRCASPTLTRLMPASAHDRDVLIRRRGIDAIFSGQGGDHFFQQMKTPLIAAEYAQRQGLRGDLFDIIRDTAHFTKLPIWSVIATVIASGVLRLHTDPYDRIPPPRLVTDAARSALRRDRFRHPWLDSAADLPASKRLQIFNIVDSQNFYAVPSQHADVIHPLISQPIIEMCLRIPCYVLTYGGIDRALVRDAFTGRVPPEIIRRTVKGGTTSYANGLLVKNLPFLREYLLRGLLVEEGLLDRCETGRCLTESTLVRDSGLLFPLLNVVRAEAWLRTWVSGEPRAAT